MAFTPLSRARKSFLFQRVTADPGCNVPAAATTMSRYRSISFPRSYSMTYIGKEYARLSTAVAASPIARNMRRRSTFFLHMPFLSPEKRNARPISLATPIRATSPLFGNRNWLMWRRWCRPWLHIRKGAAKQSFRPLCHPMRRFAPCLYAIFLLNAGLEGLDGRISSPSAFQLRGFCRKRAYPPLQIRRKQRWAMRYCSARLQHVVENERPSREWETLPFCGRMLSRRLRRDGCARRRS